MPRIGWLSWPRVCVVCGRYTHAVLDCCPDCEASLPTIDVACQRCARPVCEPVRLCERCVMALPAYDSAWAAFRHEGVIARLLDRFKNYADLSAGHVLAALMARQWHAQQRPRPDVLIPVPMHWSRFWVRGFQHTHQLARDLSRELGDVRWQAALKVRHRVARQAHTDPQGRWLNSHNSMALRSTRPFKRQSLRGLSVALVDDVVVSGATAHEAARVLKHHGVEHVAIWALARGAWPETAED